MKRTPRSAIRRASRQLALNVPSPLRVPYMSRMCWGSSEKSTKSGTLVCIRNASSYWAMRVAISGSRVQSCCSALSSLTASISPFCISPLTPFGLLT